MNYKESTLRRFVKDYSLPIQAITNELMPYYIDLYDFILDTKKKWNIFESTVAEFKTEEEFINYRSELITIITNAIKETDGYENFINCDMDIMPVHKEIEGISYNKSGHVSLYTQTNSGKYFISIDIRKANYQALKSFDPSIVMSTSNYEELIRKFTDLEYFIYSKSLRQKIFGNLCSDRITRYERFLNEKVLDWVIHTDYPKDKIISFTTDEILLECVPQMFLGSRGCQTIQDSIYSYCGVDVKVEDFRLKYIGEDFYVKEHCDNIPPTFKKGSSIYFPQAYKYYMKMPIDNKDLYFVYEKQLAKFINPKFNAMEVIL